VRQQKCCALERQCKLTGGDKDKEIDDNLDDLLDDMSHDN
jgi:hypothetical protein